MNVVNLKNNFQLLTDILSENITVYEEIQGNRLFVNFNGRNWTFKPKSLSNQPLSHIDLTIQKYYIPAVRHFQGLSTDVKNLLNPNWWFSFEYFPVEQPANVAYDKKPLNGLILTTICKKINDKTIWVNNLSELSEYGKLMLCDIQPIIFNGKLSEEQRKALTAFLQTSEQDLEFLFGEESFSYYFYKVLNPYLDSSFLMNKSKFNDNIEKIVIKTNTGVGKTITTALLNPFYKKISNENKTKHKETFGRIVADFAQHVESIKIESISLTSKSRQTAFLEMICKLFNTYALLGSGTSLQWIIEIPEYMSEDRFKINIGAIEDPITKGILSKNEQAQYIFKVICSSIINKIKLDNDFGDLIQTSMCRLHERISSLINKHLGIEEFRPSKEKIKRKLNELSVK